MSCSRSLVRFSSDWWRNTLNNPKYVLSPMVDQSERAFRMLTRRYGVGLAYTPMLLAEPFAAEDLSYRLSQFDAWAPVRPRTAEGGQAEMPRLDRPLIAQLAGDDPATMVAAGRILAPHVDAIDVNFGCPTEEARVGGREHLAPNTKRFGAYMLADQPLCEEIVRALSSDDVAAVPVTVKMRLLCGPDGEMSIGATTAFAKAMERAGASALCVHGRTVLQIPKYAARMLATRRGSGIDMAPNWAAIRAVVRAVNIPVIANGGVESKKEADRCLAATGAAGVMSAEAVLENPALFSGMQLEDHPRTMLHLAREYLDLAERFPSPLPHPPTKPHLFKILHKLLGADHAVARERERAGLALTLAEKLKLVLMRCPAGDLRAIRNGVDEIERLCDQHAEKQELLGISWYRRWPRGGELARGRRARASGGLLGAGAWAMENNELSSVRKKIRS